MARCGSTRRRPRPVATRIPPAGYQGRSFYNGGGFIVGEALGPVVPVESGLSEVIPSWNADTPAGTWIELQARVKIGERWSAWYNMGIWATRFQHDRAPLGSSAERR